MQIRELHIENFRRITCLSWKPGGDLVAIVGPGDSRKSTILDAIEAALSSRWYQFTDADFPQCDTTKALEVRVTVGELPTEALRDKRFGLGLDQAQRLLAGARGAAARDGPPTIGCECVFGTPEPPGSNFRHTRAVRDTRHRV